MRKEPYYLTVLKDEFQRRKDVNPEYSLRSYAYEIGLHFSSLSMILNGKRRLSPRIAKRVCGSFSLSPIDQTRFMESTSPEGALDRIQIYDDGPSEEEMIIDDSYYAVIAEWEHYVVLRLFDLEGFQVTPESAAAKLGVSKERINEVFENLLSCGLLKNEDGTLIPYKGYIRTTEDIPSDALLASHQETMDMGKAKLALSPELRDYSSSTLAIDRNKLAEAKIVIREFRKKMASLLSSGPKSDVYQLAIQFYPMTEIDP